MNKQRVFKEIKHIGIIAVIFAVLYLTGLHTDVAAFTQRVILQTGIITPDVELPEAEQETFDYNLKLTAIDGQQAHLTDFEGKVLFINIWATWCPPCIAEMPGIQDLYDETNNDVIFIMLSMDDSQEKAKQFIEKKGFTFPVYLPASKVPEVMRAPSIPTTLVVNKEGKVVAKKVGMAKYNTKKFKRFLEELSE